MSYNKKLTIGLFGYGVVGEAVFQVLAGTPSLNAVVKKICIKNQQKKRNIAPSHFTDDKNILLNDPGINVIIEVIDDATASFEIVRAALSRGKAVITANKKMVAENLSELIALQQKHGVPVLYESACCASIPVVRNLEEYYDNDLLKGIEGIINGSTNFILSRMFDANEDYHSALSSAKKKGFAESDPHLDVSGRDAANKLCILLAHAYGILAKPEDLLYGGIAALKPADAEVAAAQNCHVKLVARAIKLDHGEVVAFVLPQFVKSDHLLFNVKNEFNGVVLASTLADEQFFYGKGAGGFPTASAILSDLSALRYDYKYEYKKLLQQAPALLCDDVLLNVYVSFDRWEKLPVDAMEEVSEYYSGHQFHYRKGTVSLAKLRQESWWKEEGVSLILCENAVVGSGTRVAESKEGEKTPALVSVV
ncbi:MAG: homoserine dehydrogenase [Saprospiraceae bacterium]